MTAPRNISDYSIADIQHALNTRSVSCLEIVEAYLERIKEREHEIRSFLFLDQDGSKASARELDSKIKSQESLPPLAGVVLAIKDNIVVRGMPATAGSRMLENYRPPYEATAVARLRSHGAIVIGKTNLDEFGMGASTEHSGFFPTHNPLDPDRVPGGSSGGSAAAVAAGLCTAALGSDTGGSVRQPAALCGVVGMRPSYGMVSRNGLIALASSMDVIGPIVRSVADARTLLTVMSGYDPEDATTLPHQRVTTTDEAHFRLKGLRVGIPQEYVQAISNTPIQQPFARVMETLADNGSQLIQLSLATTSVAVATYYVITPAEASSNLARYDGIRFGHVPNLQHGHGLASARLRGERFGPEPKRRILTGTFTLSSGYADRYYRTAQKVRTLIRQDFSKAFTQVDVLLTPTTPTVAFPLKSKPDPVDMYREDVFLAAASLAGLPAISIPAADVSGLPVGVQLIANQDQDSKLLAVAQSLESLLEKTGKGV